MRACDDLKHSMTNLTCTVETPIQLLPWDNIAQISAILAAGGGDWVMFKAYRKAANKQLPIDPADQNTAVIALRHPHRAPLVRLHRANPDFRVVGRCPPL